MLNGILQKTLASISILQTQNYKSIEKFVNVLQQYTKKLAETSVSKFKIALHIENLQCTQRHITKNVSEYKHTANAELQKCRKICKYTLKNIQKS